ncbi:MAG: V-type ATP synthase subunit I [Candidatus Cryptobacteroides sp.]
MIEKMTKYSFILLSGETEGFLEWLQGLGVVDVTRSSKPIDERSATMLEKISRVKKTLGILEKLDYSSDPDYERIRKAADETVIQGCKAQNSLRTVSRIEDLNAEMAEAEKQLKDVAPWGDYDKAALDGITSKGLVLRYYKVSSKKFDPAWEDEYALVKVNEDKKTIWFVTLSPASEDYSFPVPECPAPALSVREAEAKINGINEELIAQKGKLLHLKENYLDHIRQGWARKSADLDRYLATAGTSEAAEGYVTVITGFAPSANDADLKAECDEKGVLYIAEAAEDEDNPPIKLKNNRFVKMFEVLTDMYGRPAYNGFDPTPYISIFFMLFFAMCMGDAGYGLILIAGGFALKKVKSFADYAPLVTILGVATMVVGFFFHTFFSIDISSWSWVQNSGLDKIMVPDKIIGYDGTMVVAIIVGIIHLCLAMIVKTVNATRNQGFLNSLSIWGWTIFLVGTVVVLAATFALNIDSAITKWIIIGLGILGAIGIFPLRNLHKNPLINIGGGLWETYNTATGLLGDVLSYLRLYALGLAGSMLGYAFNTLALMALGDGGFGWIAFIAIALIGHVLNIAMAVLGAFVHPLRLNFLEFFKNSDYDGSGRNYNPLKNITNN